MTADQIAIVVILAATLAAYAVYRRRPELIALLALAATAAMGLVRADTIFSGFSDPAVVTVVEILMLVQLLTRSGIVDRLASRALLRLTNERDLLLFLTASGAALSAFMNNIAALALMLPAAYSGCRLLGIAPKQVLMPLSFATLLGGMCSLIGTPANLVVSAARTEALGVPMQFFDYAVAGVPAAALGVFWLWASYRPMRKRNKTPRAETGSARSEGVLFEARVSRPSSWIGRSAREVEAIELAEILNVVRGGKFVFGRRESLTLEEGDIVVIRGDSALFERLFDAGEVDAASDATTLVHEAVVAPMSMIVGSTAGELLAFAGRDVRIVGLRGAQLRADGRLEDVRLAIGDVILAVGDRKNVETAIEESGCFALAGRRKTAPGALTPAAALTFLGGVLLSAFQIAPPAVAFGGALLAAALAGTVSLPSLIRRVDWRVVIMLAALIPVAGAFAKSGAAAEIARPLIAASLGDKTLLIASVWMLSVLTTAFLNNVASAAIISPIALGAAEIGGVSPDALLLAVAVGVSTDFLTPFGHHNNTIVMGAGGYDLRDFAVRGIPLTLIVGAVAILALTIGF